MLDKEMSTMLIGSNVPDTACSWAVEGRGEMTTAGKFERIGIRGVVSGVVARLRKKLSSCALKYACYKVCP